MLNPNLTKEDAQWLINEFNQMRGGRIDSKTIGMFTKAINLIRGTNSGNPSCSCQWKSQSSIANSLYGQHEANIKEIANAV